MNSWLNVWVDFLIGSVAKSRCISGNINAPGLKSLLKHKHSRVQHNWLYFTDSSVLSPEFDLLCCCDDRGDAAGVHLEQRHMGRGVRGEEGRAGGLCPLHVPARQAELEALGVMSEETLAQRQADATAERHVQWSIWSSDIRHHQSEKVNRL